MEKFDSSLCVICYQASERMVCTSKLRRVPSVHQHVISCLSLKLSVAVAVAGCTRKMTQRCRSYTMSCDRCRDTAQLLHNGKHTDIQKCGRFAVEEKSLLQHFCEHS